MSTALRCGHIYSPECAVRTATGSLAEFGEMGSGVAEFRHVSECRKWPVTKNCVIRNSLYNFFFFHSDGSNGFASITGTLFLLSPCTVSANVRDLDGPECQKTHKCASVTALAHLLRFAPFCGICQLFFPKIFFETVFFKWSTVMRTFFAVSWCPTGNHPWRRWAWTHTCWPFSTFFAGVTRVLRWVEKMAYGNANLLPYH